MVLGASWLSGIHQKGERGWAAWLTLSKTLVVGTLCPVIFLPVRFPLQCTAGETKWHLNSTTLQHGRLGLFYLSMHAGTVKREPPTVFLTSGLSVCVLTKEPQLHICCLVAGVAHHMAVGVGDWQPPTTDRHFCVLEALFMVLLSLEGKIALVEVFRDENLTAG